MKDKILKFPSTFMWGTATSSHQVEGNNHLNDWWAFEQQPGRIHDGRPSGAACSQYELYTEDMALISQLHQNAHRFSLEWSRIEPQEGKFDKEAIAHYRAMLEQLLALNIEPMVTIHHFSNPVWLSALGGWETPAVIPYFERFVALVAQEYGDLVKYWVTINEPMVYALMGYLLCLWPPAKFNIPLAFSCAKNMMRAHAVAYEVLHRQARRTPSVGVAHNIRVFDPANPNSWLDTQTAAFQDYLFNETIIKALMEGSLYPPLGVGPIANTARMIDFIGVNYYSRDMVQFDIKQPGNLFGNNLPSAGSETNLFGWEIYAEGLYRICQRLAPYDCPIIITENGIPDDTDEQRPRMLLEHVAVLHKAISEGIKVEGYFHWSLIDNFEWAEGYRTPFGLVEVDFETQKRTVKDSGRLYAEICRTNSITPEMWTQVKPRSNTPKRKVNIYGEK